MPLPTLPTASDFYLANLISFSPNTDPLGIQHLARIRRHPAPTIHATTHRRSRNHNDALPLRAGFVPSPLYPELAVPLFRRGIRGSDPLDRGRRPDGAVQ